MSLILSGEGNITGVNKIAVVAGGTGIINATWTTATRPDSPILGQQGYNTTLGAMETYTGGNVWAQSIAAGEPITGDVDASGSVISGNVVTAQNGFIASWTTAGRPSNPTIGQSGFNSDLNTNEVWTGSSWYNGVPSAITGQNGVWSYYTTSNTYTVPAGVSLIRAYAGGAGATGSGAGGGGGGFAWGNIVVSGGQSFSVSIAGGVATFSSGGTTYLIANPASGTTGGTATKHASVTGGGTSSGGSGAGGGGGGGSCGSVLGPGNPGGSDSGAGGGGGGIGGAGGPGGGAPFQGGGGGGGAGGAGGAGSAGGGSYGGGGGAGGSGSTRVPGSGRSAVTAFTDPLLLNAVMPGGGSEGASAGPGGGGSGTAYGSSNRGGNGGDFGGGGGGGGGGPAGNGGLMGGGGGGGPAGSGGLGGGGGGPNGTGGGAFIFIYAYY